MTSGSGADLDATFEALYQTYGEPLLNYLYRLLGGRAEAEEAMQDTFVKAYRALARLPQDANVRAWLYRIATNTARDRLRRRRLIQWLPLQDTDRSDTALDHPAALATDHTDVGRALAQLAPIYREPLILYTVQGYDTQEIATMLGISRSAVKKRLVRAREQFARAHGGDGDEQM
jgi:RNA polymerase sigma-70 factor (ECF subfamily)